jgi:hypothetical protein
MRSITARFKSTESPFCALLPCGGGSLIQSADDPDWGYPKSRDARSRGYSIAANTMTGVKTPMQITGTDNVVLDSTGALALPAAPRFDSARDDRDAQNFGTSSRSLSSNPVR